MAYQIGPAPVTITAPDNLVFYFDPANPRCYPGSGTTVYSLGTNQYTGDLISNPAYSAEAGGIFTFDGTNDYISFGDILNYGAEDFTFSYWATFFPENTGSTRGVFGRQGINSYYDSILNYFSIKYLRFYVGGTSSSANNLILDTWMNITLVRANNTAYIYYNGILNNIDYTTTGIPSSSSPFTLGGTPNNGRYHYGKLSWVRSYNRALSPAEIDQVYQTSKSRFFTT